MAVRLHLNESPWDLPPEAKAWVADQAWHLYPDEALYDLVRTKVADRWNVPAESVILTNGADEAIALLMLWYRRVAFWRPSFSGYAWVARGWELDAVEIPLGPDFEVPWTAMWEHRDRLLLLDRPHNPSGMCLFGRAELADLLERWQAWVVLDETYADFARDSLTDVFDPDGRLIVLRSFSKSFCMAGLRLGFMVVPRPVRRPLEARRLPFNVNRLALYAALWVLERPELFQTYVNAVCRERQAMLERMARLPGLRVWPSEANFILFRGPLPLEGLVRRLDMAGIRIRPLEDVVGPGAGRVSVGRPEDNARFLDILEAYYAPAVSDRMAVP